MQPEPYTTVFSGTTSDEFRWQQAPMMQPLLRITFRPRSAEVSHENIKSMLDQRVMLLHCLLLNFCEKTECGKKSNTHNLNHTTGCASRIYLWIRLHCCLQFSTLERLKQIRLRISNLPWNIFSQGTYYQCWLTEQDNIEKLFRIPHPTSNTLLMPMVIVFGSAPSLSGMMFSG